MLGKTTREIVFHFVKRFHILFSPTKKALKEAIQEINFRNADHFIAKRCSVNAGVKFFTQYSTEIMRRKTFCWWLIWLGGKSNKSVIYSAWDPNHTIACFEKRKNPKFYWFIIQYKNLDSFVFSSVMLIIFERLKSGFILLSTEP